MTDPAGRGPDPAALRGRPPYVDVAAAVLAAVTLRIAWFLVGMRNSAIESDALDNPLIVALFVNPTTINTTAPDSGNTQDETWEDVRRNLGYTADYAARIDVASMTPQGELSSSTYCLARTVSHRPAYLAYSPDGGPLTLDLAASRQALEVEWFDPKRGVRQPGPVVLGGSKTTFQPPFDGDAVLYLWRNDSSEPGRQDTIR